MEDLIEGRYRELSQVCDLWENVHAFWGVQIALEFSYGANIWPSYCQILYTVYDTSQALPDVLLQHERIIPNLHWSVDATDLYNDLRMIETTFSRNRDQYAAPGSPAATLLKADDVDAFLIMREWWNARGRGEHV